MAEFILLLSMWPFHHKPSAETFTVDCHKELGCRMWDRGYELFESQNGCEKSGELYFYAGEDGLINFSPASCDAAKHNWSVMHIDPVRMSRS